MISVPEGHQWPVSMTTPLNELAPKPRRINTQGHQFVLNSLFNQTYHWPTVLESCSVFEAKHVTNESAEWKGTPGWVEERAGFERCPKLHFSVFNDFALRMPLEHFPLAQAGIFLGSLRLATESAESALSRWACPQWINSPFWNVPLHTWACARQPGEGKKHPLYLQTIDV